MQRFGTYNSGDFNLQLNHHLFNRLNLSYNFKKGANSRRYNDDPDNDFHLKNTLTYHTGNINYNFSENPEINSDSQLNGSYIYSNTTFNDYRYDESIGNLNRLFSVRYSGNIAMLTDLNLVGSKQLLDKNESLNISDSFHSRTFKNDRIYLNLEKAFKLNPVSFMIAYQYEDAGLDYSDFKDPVIIPDPGVKSGYFTQKRNGLVSIIKIHTPTGSHLLQKADFDISYRYDNVLNRSERVVFHDPDFSDRNIANNDWGFSTVKLSAHLSGNHTIAKYSTFLNYGTNIKFPTLFQQLSTPAVADPNIPGVNANLDPEKNRSLEIGVEMVREFENPGNMDGWQLAATYFQNYYENKFRSYTLPGIPVSFYENVPTADISGFEGQVAGYFFRKKLTVEFAFSDYSISDKASFPFKYDTKFVANLFIDHAGYSFQLHWFKESEQIGLILDRSGAFVGLPLPAYQNMDIHIGKNFELWDVKLFTNFTVRNLFDDDTQLEGIAIRDRRFYLSLGFEY
jgi:hypothetical protein